MYSFGSAAAGMSDDLALVTVTMNNNHMNRNPKMTVGEWGARRSGRGICMQIAYSDRQFCGIDIGTAILANYCSSF